MDCQEKYMRDRACPWQFLKQDARVSMDCQEKYERQRLYDSTEKEVTCIESGVGCALRR